ncbi:hypothetical protein [Paraferrimonas sp. SM1919]|uniref:hypothetical protein n=1 Tax=Paraferrimonas sp. SM1919 TaxID=2662263 RepID=UPI0013D1B5B8|nr:hypothetical protein [Paraferrimonas sp. SM1919]
MEFKKWTSIAAVLLFLTACNSEDTSEEGEVILEGGTFYSPTPIEDGVQLFINKDANKNYFSYDANAGDYVGLFVDLPTYGYKEAVREDGELTVQVGNQLVARTSDYNPTLSFETYSDRYVIHANYPGHEGLMTASISEQPEGYRKLAVSFGGAYLNNDAYVNVQADPISTGGFLYNSDESVHYQNTGKVVQFYSTSPKTTSVLMKPVDYNTYESGNWLSMKIADLIPYLEGGYESYDSYTGVTYLYACLVYDTNEIVGMYRRSKEGQTSVDSCEYEGENLADYFLRSVVN